MQVFTVKVVGTKLSAQDIENALWQTTELARGEILVEEGQEIEEVKF